MRHYCISTGRLDNRTPGHRVWNNKDCPCGFKGADIKELFKHYKADHKGQCPFPSRDDPNKLCTRQTATDMTMRHMNTHAHSDLRLKISEIRALQGHTPDKPKSEAARARHNEQKLAKNRTPEQQERVKAHRAERYAHEKAMLELQRKAAQQPSSDE